MIGIPEAFTLRSGAVLQAFKQKLDGGGCIGSENEVKITWISIEETKRSKPDRCNALAGLQ